MEISNMQLYSFCHRISTCLITEFLRFGGKAELDTGMRLLEQAKDNQWNVESLKEALGCFKSAGKLLEDETKIAAYLNACLCCFYLKDKEQFLICKDILNNLVFPERTRKYIKDIGIDPTGFLTIFRIIKSLCTGSKYKNRLTKAKEAEALFYLNKKEALDLVESMQF